jgi:hypothetical protein
VRGLTYLIIKLISLELDDSRVSKIRRAEFAKNRARDFQLILRQPRSLTGIRAGDCRFAGAWAALR